MSTSIYTLRHNSAAIGCIHKKTNFIVGFKSLNLARKIHYNLQCPDHGMHMMEGIRRLHNNELNIEFDVEATLFLPKSRNDRATLNAIDDLGIYLDTMDITQFYNIPFKTMTGLIIPLLILDETEEEFVIRSHVLYPVPDDLVGFKESLRKSLD